jgi:F0F1-type ATP synthase membrane subunit a
LVYNISVLGVKTMVVVGGYNPGLTVFLTLVETVSILIRPFTLSIRLLLNLLFGHYLVYYIRVGLLYLGFPLLPLVLLYEFFVIVLQAFVFSHLLVIYLDES